MVTITVKNGKAQLCTKRDTIELKPISRKGNCDYQKFAVKNGKAICQVWAKPKFNGKVSLEESGTSAHAHKFTGVNRGNLIVSTVYVAKMGKKINVH